MENREEKTHELALQVINYEREREREQVKNEGWRVLINRPLSKYHLAEFLLIRQMERERTLLAFATFEKIYEGKGSLPPREFLNSLETAYFKTAKVPRASMQR